jgi:hypothetical protein
VIGAGNASPIDATPSPGAGPDVARPVVTILTDPVPSGRHLITEPLRHVARSVLRTLRPLPEYVRSSRYRGHFAVTRSLVEGLEHTGVNFTYNPMRLSEVADSVVVLSGIKALRQAIAWRRRGRIRRLLAGPNMVEFPDEQNSVVASPEVDLCITPANGICDLYIGWCPPLAGRCEPWPAGVDTRFWRPDPHKRRSDTVLFYVKRVQNEPSLDSYESVLRRAGLRILRLVYGHYSHQQYLAALQESSLLVGFTTNESQGLAWAEAWSTDVPTLIRACDTDTIKGRRFACSSAPYLNPATGAFFASRDGGLDASVADLEGAVQRWAADRDQFHPRAWVLENMSDEVCAGMLLELARVPSANGSKSGR